VRRSTFNGTHGPPRPQIVDPDALERCRARFFRGGNGQSTLDVDLLEALLTGAAIGAAMYVAALTDG
jgi:hypothetical protein